LKALGGAGPKSRADVLEVMEGVEARGDIEVSKKGLLIEAVRELGLAHLWSGG